MEYFLVTGSHCLISSNGKGKACFMPLPKVASAGDLTVYILGHSNLLELKDKAKKEHKQSP